MNISNIKEKIIKMKEQSRTSLNNLMEDLISNMKLEIDSTKLTIIDIPEDLGGFMKKKITDMETAVINQEKIKYFKEIMKNIKNDIKETVEDMKQNKIDFITMSSIILLLEDLILSNGINKDLGLIRNIAEFLPYNDTINTAIMSAGIIAASKIIKTMLNKFKVKPTIQADNLHDDFNLFDNDNNGSNLENKNNQTQKDSSNIQKMSEKFKIRFENPSFKLSENERTDINKNTNITKNVSTLLKKETEEISSFVNESSLTNIKKINNEISLNKI